MEQSQLTSQRDGIVYQEVDPSPKTRVTKQDRDQVEARRRIEELHLQKQERELFEL